MAAASADACLTTNMRQSRAPDRGKWRGRRVTVMGLGRHGGGLGAVRYLARHGALVTVSDASHADSLVEQLVALDDSLLQAVHLGGHLDSDFSEAEFVVVNPAVRPGHPSLQLARSCGARLTSEIEIFLEVCPAHVIGVTGSNGKSTTVTMLAEILRAAGRRTWLGGNLGGSLLADVEQMTADDWVVLELSSFQLAHLNDAARWPELALVTNCSPNHLDWHGTFQEYVAAKQRLVRGAKSCAVLNGHDPVVSQWSTLAPARLLCGWPVEALPPLRAPGFHNQANAACAAAIAEAAGVDRPTISRALSDFKGLDHRLQFVAEVTGRRFYNDSKSTSPAATLAALEAVPGPVWLLAGGDAKGASFVDLAQIVAARSRGVAIYGASRETLHAAISDAIVTHALPCKIFVGDDLHAALAWCWNNSSVGDAILLSPACASLDQFAGFEQRGEVFCRAVREHTPRA